MAARVKKELQDWERTPLIDCSAGPIGKDIFKWKAAISTHTGPYKDGVFLLNIEIPKDYPFTPPHVSFETKIFHCNVSDCGEIGIDILHNTWAPTHTISKVLLSISSMIVHPKPNANYIKNLGALQLYTDNIVQHDMIANEWAVKYAHATKQSKQYIEEKYKLRTALEKKRKQKQLMDKKNELKEEAKLAELGRNGLKEYKKNLYKPKVNLLCQECEILFERHADYISHMKQTHNISKPYICDMCNKEYTTKRNLVSHIECKHIKTINYECDICYKQFYHKALYTDHCSTHKRKVEKEYVCDQCGKRFKQKRCLKTHIRGVHNKEKRYECDVCGKRFFRKCNLIPHQRMHTGEKPYECDVCTRRFSRSNHLQRHRRIHSGDKPFLCCVCNKPFAHRCMRNAHQKDCKK